MSVSKIIVAIPAFNESLCIGEIVRIAKPFCDTVGVIDDGSTDDTKEVAQINGAVVRQHSKNQGYGSSIKSCIDLAIELDGDILVILDGDGQHNPSEIPKLVQPIIIGEADLVIGSRLLKDGPKIPLYRRFGIWIITAAYNFNSRSPVTDAQSGFRAYNRRAFGQLNINETGMGASLQTLLEADTLKLRIKEVSITCLYPKFSHSMNPISHGFSVLLALLKLRIRTFRRHQNSSR
jgi:glycosyltransferase involved in cell wall biosynthesis